MCRRSLSFRAIPAVPMCSSVFITLYNPFVNILRLYSGAQIGHLNIFFKRSYFLAFSCKIMQFVRYRTIACLCLCLFRVIDVPLLRLHSKELGEKLLLVGSL